MADLAETDEDTGSVSLAVPARAEYLGVLRVAAAAVGVRAGLDYEEVEDLRIAADELCYLVMHAAGYQGDLSLDFAVRPGYIELTGTLPCPPRDEPVQPTELMARILAGAVDMFSLDENDDQVRFHLVKKHTGEPPG